MNEKYFAIIDNTTNTVTTIVTTQGEEFQTYAGYTAISLTFHDVTLFGKVYSNGKFI